MNQAGEGGPMLYHRCEVACDIAAAAINILFGLDYLAILADWLKYASTGKTFLFIFGLPKN